MLKQVEGDAGLPVPKEAGQQETILVRIDGFQKVFKYRYNCISEGFRDLLEATC